MLKRREEKQKRKKERKEEELTSFWIHDGVEERIVVLGVVGVKQEGGYDSVLMIFTKIWKYVFVCVNSVSLIGCALIFAALCV